MVGLRVLKMGETPKDWVYLNDFVEDVGSEPSVKCGLWTGRKEGASLPGERLEPADALCWLWWRRACGLSGNTKATSKVSGFRRLRALCSWATGEFPVLFPPPNESSFRTLTCLLAWPQEGNDAACSSSPRLCLDSEHQKRGRSGEAPFRVEAHTATQGSAGWTPTCLPWWQCLGPRAEGSMSSCGGNGSDRMYLLVLPSNPLHSHTPGF